MGVEEDKVVVEERPDFGPLQTRGLDELIEGQLVWECSLFPGMESKRMVRVGKVYDVGEYLGGGRFLEVHDPETGEYLRSLGLGDFNLSAYGSKGAWNRYYYLERVELIVEV